MFENNFTSPYRFNTMPTATQPYGYPINPYTPNSQVHNSNTNKIFVNGLEDARNRFVPSGGSAIFLDNDKPLLYDKTVDSKGQFEIKVFDISEHKDHNDLKANDSIDLSSYVLKADLEPIESEIRHIKEMLNKNTPMGV